MNLLLIILMFFFNDTLNTNNLKYTKSNNRVETYYFTKLRNSIKFQIQKKSSIKDRYDRILRVSDIIYNYKKNKAVVIVAYTLNKYSSSTSIFLPQNTEMIMKVQLLNLSLAFIILSWIHHKFSKFLTWK